MLPMFAHCQLQSPVQLSVEGQAEAPVTLLINISGSRCLSKLKWILISSGNSPAFHSEKRETRCFSITFLFKDIYIFSSKRFTSLHNNDAIVKLCERMFYVDFIMCRCLEAVF